jgi:outer membrane protein OmpA-like peptidoglycan-associated protein
MKRYISTIILLLVGFSGFAQAEKIRLSSNINTEFEETAPMVSPDGGMLYFVRKGDPKNNGQADEADIWVSRKQLDQSWSRAVNVGAPLNNRFSNRIVSIIPAGHQLYLINTYKKSSSQLAFSQREGRTWGFPQKVKLDSLGDPRAGIDFNINSWGNIMVVSMARKDAIGQRDLYVSIKKQDGQWSSPKHMGDVINTSRQEFYVFLALDGKTLYFSSNGHGGFGGMDLFVSRRLDETWTNWSKPENLGEQVNNKADNIFITVPAAGNPAYIVDKGEGGITDLYSVQLADKFLANPVVLVHGRVVTAAGNTAIEGVEDVINVNAPQARSALESKRKEFKVIVPYGEEVSLHTNVEGYYPVSPPLAFGETQTQSQVDFDSRNILASSNLGQGYYQRDDEIESLSLKLDTLSNELQQLEIARQAYREKLGQDRKSGNAILPQDDPALNALKHKYTAYLHGLKDTVPPTKKAKKARADKDLEEMKKRYRSYYKIKENPKTQPAAGSRYLDNEENERFEKMKDSIALELKVALKPKVQEELKKELEGEVRKEVVGEIDAPSKKYLFDESKKEWELHLQNNLKGKDITVKGVSTPPKKEVAAWEKQLEKDIKSTIQDDVESDLRNTMKEDVKGALKEEAIYFAKKKRAEEVEAVLQQRILQQIKEEERQTERGRYIPDSYESQVKSLTPPTYREVEQNLLLIPATVGQTIPLHHIYFNPNTAQFKAKAYTELERMVLFLQENAAIKIEIGGHTNGWLSHSQSMQLSKQRAQAVADYLTSHGIAEARVTHKGYGKIRPLADNDTLEGRRKNQRIEMKILE